MLFHASMKSLSAATDPQNNTTGKISRQLLFSAVLAKCFAMRLET